MAEIQLIYKLAVIFLYSFFATYWAVPYVISKLKKFNFSTEDRYKPHKPKIPKLGGVAILVGILISLSLSQILLNREDLGALFIFYFVVIVYALYGIIDDLFHFKRRYDKIFVVLILTFPIASMIKDTSLNLIFFHLEIGPLYSLVVIPVFIMFVANAINIHAGYNGLTTGLSLILLTTIGIKSYVNHGVEYMVFFLPVFGALLAFFPYNYYPARILPGNIGDFLVGGAIGALLAINQLLWFGIFILIPHFVNFLLDTWTILIRRNKDIKFGRLRKDGTIEPPPSMKYKSLKFLVVSRWRLTEKQATLLLYAFTTFFCVFALIIF